MSKLTVELPENVHKYAESKVASGDFASVTEYLVWLVSNEARLAQIDRLLDEADEDYEAGRYVEHKPGDIKRMANEVIERHRAANQ